MRSGKAFLSCSLSYFLHCLCLLFAPLKVYITYIFLPTFGILNPLKKYQVCNRLSTFLFLLQAFKSIGPIYLATDGYHKSLVIRRNKNKVCGNNSKKKYRSFSFYIIGKKIDLYHILTWKYCGKLSSVAFNWISQESFSRIIKFLTASVFCIYISLTCSELFDLLHHKLIKNWYAFSAKFQ